jgi:hypothetical protein
MHVRVWTQGIFRAGNFILEDLIDTLADADFGAFIFLPEDILTMRGTTEPAVRDNVLFELGLFIGHLGRKRAFFVKPRGAMLHLPTDLSGVNACDFDIEDPNRTAGIGTAATEILEIVRAYAEKASPAAALISPSVTPIYDREAVRQQLSSSARKPLLRGSKYTRNDIISTTGDVRIVEKWENISAFDDTPLSELQLTFSSRSGRQTDCKCESLTYGQKVEWKWQQTNDEEARSVLVFEPPLTQSRSISFRTDRYVFNGVAFTQADRLEITGGKSSEEEIRAVYRHAWDICVFQIKFPEHRFPKTFQVAAFRLNGEALIPESELIARDLDILPETQNALLKIPTPLPDVRYRISWQLPEGNSSIFSSVEQGFIDEVTRRLLGLRVLQAAVPAVSDALSEARIKFISAAGAKPKEDIQVSLYVYDRQRAGLVCTATEGAPLVEQNWARFFFKPGRGVVGTAFRQRASTIYIRDHEPAERDLFEQKLAKNEAFRPHAVVCIPLFYPGHTQHTLAVLSFESLVPSSTLLPFLSQPKASLELQATFRDWYTGALAQAIGMPSSHHYWHGKTAVGASA